MQKVLSIVLLALFGLPAVSPLFVQAASADGSLPACCRRDGRHHCVGAMQNMGTGPALKSPPCAEFPARTVAPSQAHRFTVGGASLAFAEIVSHPTLHRQTEARARVALDRSRRKRGPPATQLF